jgi:anti-sigma factor RsiW
MTHLSDLDLIEMASGRLPPEPQRRAEAHLADCPECRQRLRASQHTWQALDAWPVSAEGRSVAEAVEAAASRIRPAAASQRRLYPVLRAAAVVAVAVVAGYLSGRYVRLQRAEEPAAPLVETAARRQAAADSLYLNVLASGSATGLPDGVLPTADTESEVQP